MQEKTVKVTIDKKGNAKVDLVGFRGEGCGQLADKLKSVGRVTSETTKTEFFEGNSSSVELDSYAA